MFQYPLFDLIRAVLSGCFLLYVGDKLTLVVMVLLWIVPLQHLVYLDNIGVALATLEAVSGAIKAEY